MNSLNDASVPSGTSTSLRAKIALIGGSALLTLGLCELALWTFLPIAHPYAAADSADRRIYDEFRRVPLNRYVPSYNSPRDLVFKPDLKILPGVSESVSFSINSFGFRNTRMTDVKKPDGEIRVFAVGGSTTECLYLDGKDAWPEVLQRALVGSTPRVNVINAGRSGDTTRDHLPLLSQRILAFSPDYVLFLVGVNDLGLHLEADYSPIRSDERSFVRESRVTPGTWIRTSMAEYSQVVRRLILLRRGGLKEDERGNPVQDAAGQWIQAARDRRAQLPVQDVDVGSLPRAEYEQNIRALVAITRSAGAEAVLMTQPVLWGAPPGDWEKSLWVAYAGRVPQDVLWRAMERFNDVVRRVAADLKVPLVDLARELPKSTDLFYDDDHFTVEGARRVADLVAAGIPKGGLLEVRR